MFELEYVKELMRNYVTNGIFSGKKDNKILQFFAAAYTKIESCRFEENDALVAAFLLENISVIVEMKNVLSSEVVGNSVSWQYFEHAYMLFKFRFENGL